MVAIFGRGSSSSHGVSAQLTRPIAGHATEGTGELNESGQCCQVLCESQAW